MKKSKLSPINIDRLFAVANCANAPKSGGITINKRMSPDTALYY